MFAGSKPLKNVFQQSMLITALCAGHGRQAWAKVGGGGGMATCSELWFDLQSSGGLCVL